MSINSSGAVARMKKIANGGASAGVAAKTSNPGKAQYDGGGKLSKNNPSGANGKAPAQAEKTFSQHTGHGSAARQLRESGPNIPY